MPDLAYAAARTILFQMDAERAHDLTLWLAKNLSGSAFACALAKMFYAPPADSILRSELAGLKFESPIGLAAGLDKNGVAIDFWSALGFGFVEVGTVTPGEGQIGNDKPRLARHIPQRAIINRMGFNNLGADFLADRLAHRRTAIPVGANIGKAKRTPLEEAEGDYIQGLQTVWTRSDYITINVSSPNTPGLRDLQAIDQLASLVAGVKAENARMAAAHNRAPKPLFLKIAPDLADDDLIAIAQMAKETKLDALIATNTTINAEVLNRTLPFKGGISGDPLAERALACTRILYQSLAGEIPIIGVGGIRTVEDAYARIRAGASLLQIYSGFVFEGPGLVGRLSQGLARKLRQDGYEDLNDAVGSAI